MLINVYISPPLRHVSSFVGDIITAVSNSASNIILRRLSTFHFHENIIRWKWWKRMKDFYHRMCHSCFIYPSNIIYLYCIILFHFVIVIIIIIVVLMINIRHKFVVMSNKYNKYVRECFWVGFSTANEMEMRKRSFVGLRALERLEDLARGGSLSLSNVFHCR
jgi:hypothetical protein